MPPKNKMKILLFNHRDNTYKYFLNHGSMLLVTSGNTIFMFNANFDLFLSVKFETKHTIFVVDVNNLNMKINKEVVNFHNFRIVMGCSLQVCP